jgi:putative SOS response-associated peptidase YedK
MEVLNMCGRFTVTVSYQELEEHLKEYYDIHELPLFDVPRYNIAPGQNIISVLNDGSKHRVGYLKWGFIPPFSKDESIGFQMINAKAETIFDKVSFKDSAIHKRCVILADSFYEWKKEDKGKTPHRIYLKNQKMFSFAGLWTTYQKSDGTKVHTATILTTEPNELMSSIHFRMPVILNKEDEKVWLNPRIKDKNTLLKVLKAYPSELMSADIVSNYVNQAKNDSIECIQPIHIKEKQELFD